MSGHSKWASIKHKKAVVDARRGQHFTKLARAITVAAKEGGGDPTGNASLALAIQKARDASMPKDNIERAIQKGTGSGADADSFETVMYEGYGPGGVAMLIEALTDNRNRTAADVRHVVGKYGGNLGEPGSVAYLFDKQAILRSAMLSTRAASRVRAIRYPRAESFGALRHRTLRLPIIR
jgi:YebC/PmpR family DNA-binding regulatory protein